MFNLNKSLLGKAYVHRSHRRLAPAVIGSTLNIPLLLIIMPQIACADGEIMVDPMKPPAFALHQYQLLKNKNKPASKQPQTPIEPLRLTSILYSPTRKIAIIDDQMLSPGDSIGDARLINIGRDSARLVREGKVIKLRLTSEKTVIKKNFAGNQP